MPWVRIDENAMDHPKFLAISANAWRLWCEGASYCQKHLTNGLIPRAALKGFRYYSTAALAYLTVAAVPGKGPLWHETSDGFAVHDYLDYNDSSDAVLAARARGKERKRRFLEKNASKNALRERARTPDVSRSVGGSSSQQDRLEEREGSVRETIAERAGEFCRWYEDAHQRIFGVGYMGSNGDYGKACEMARKFSDTDLRDGALFWFGQVDDFATRGTRSIVKFASRASDCVLQARKVAS